MPDIASISIKHPLYPWLFVVACLLGGIWGIETIGRLEDPIFPIKTAFVITSYPGSSALEVEQEVTDLIESSMQELPYIDLLESKSVPGRSEVMVELFETISGEEAQQIWDELRRRVGEAAQRLPPGASTPYVEDDYGDVYGFLYAVATPGYTVTEIHDISSLLSKQLSLVPGVAKVATSGEPLEAIHVELDHQRMARLGLPLEAVFNAIGSENRVIKAGSVAYGDRRLRVAPELAFNSVEALQRMRIGRPGSTEIVYLSDIADVMRGPVEVPPNIVRHNGEQVFTIGISATEGLNVVDVGDDVDQRIKELLGELPLGVEIIPTYRQHQVVRSAINTFFRNLVLSVATVIGALCLFMGWRAGTVVGSVLLLTVLGSIGIMSLLGIELHRISLGALMIAMGMLVDNAIVVTEGMVVGVHQGQSPALAATHSVRRTQFPLLGATVIGLLAFAPISLSDDKSGYFLRALFQVVAISLLLSWALAISVVPLIGSYLLKTTPQSTATKLYSGWGYAPYRALVRFGLRRWFFSTLVILAITGTCLWGFGFVKQGFFPGTNAPLFYVDFYLPQGTDILATSKKVKTIEDLVREDPEVIDITTFVGRGMSRFMATLRPEQPNPAMAQLIIRVKDATRISDNMASLRSRINELALDAEIHIYRTEFSPSGKSKFEVRFSGQDPAVLRELSDQVLQLYLQHDLINRKNNWRQPELKITPRFNEDRARMAGISRVDVYNTLAFATQGVPIGLFRDADQLFPIIARAPEHERVDVQTLPDRLVWSPTEGTHIPMSQVVSSFDVRPENGIILRRDRIRTITAQANEPIGHNFQKMFKKVQPEVEAMTLPLGYHYEWGGEHEGSKDAERLLLLKVPITFSTMFLITLLMFGRWRQTIVIWLTVPMVVCGVVLSLLATDMAFTFPSFLGLLSLTGMLIKNCIVLVDEIDKKLAEGARSLEVIAEASVSRLRPVMLAAGTTIAGMSPLLADPFFMEMAVCIMGGLAFATILTLIAVPVFYRIALGSSVQV